MQERAFNNPNIEILWNTEAEEALGDNLLKQVRIKNNQSGDVKVLMRTVFYAIGHVPNTDFLSGQPT